MPASDGRRWERDTPKQLWQTDIMATSAWPNPSEVRPNCVQGELLRVRGGGTHLLNQRCSRVRSGQVEAFVEGSDAECAEVAIERIRREAFAHRPGLVTVEFLEGLGGPDLVE